MPKPILAATIDPLASFLESRRGDRWPVPLVATAVDVDTAGGIVVVATRRVFRNDEARSIEAVLTFPVPVHATLFDLEARIGKRLLIASARRRDEAREAYEVAVTAGRTAVLHEEVLRGLHMLSVGPLAPGAEIAVTARWVSTLAFVGGEAQLRIPMTAGQIYGRTPLPETDDLVTGCGPAIAELVVRSDRPVTLAGGTLVDGRARVRTDAPIDLAMSAVAPHAVAGITAEGRTIAMTVSPTARPAADALDLAILVDRSGSMDSRENGVEEQSKHQAAVAALAQLAPKLNPPDRVDLWEFDTSVGHVGEARATEVGTATLRDQLRGLVGRLGEPRGGTEIGAALSHVIAQTAARDLLVVTDGLSHALDVQALAGRGKRISVLLVGEDSLEASVGHLAALTGGDLVVASGSDMAASLDAALGGLRLPFAATEAGDDGRRLQATRRGAEIVVSETDEPLPSAAHPIARAAGALAAALRLPLLSAGQVAALAESEGIVTHLTSLVLVDEAAEAVEGLPALRKVALPTARTADRTVVSAMSNAGRFGSFAGPGAGGHDRARLKRLRHPTRSRKLRAFIDLDPAGPPSSSALLPPSELAAMSPAGEIRVLAARIDWGGVSDRLVRGDLSGLPAETAKALLRLAARDSIVAAANRLGLDPLLVAIGCVARGVADSDRTAARVAGFIFGGIEPGTLAQALSGLSGGHRSVPSTA